MGKIAPLLILVAVVSTGCATSPYFADRGRDALDVITVGVGMGGGAKAKAGPVQAGLLFDAGWVPLIRGGEVLPDLHGSVGVPEELDIQLFPGVAFERTETGRNRGKDFCSAGLFIASEDSPWLPRTDPHPYTPSVHPPGPICWPYYTQVEVVGGVLWPVRLGINPGELVDFILGWTTIDLFNDDLRGRSSTASPLPDT